MPTFVPPISKFSVERWGKKNQWWVMSEHRSIQRNCNPVQLKTKYQNSKTSRHEPKKKKLTLQIKTHKSSQELRNHTQNTETGVEIQLKKLHFQWVGVMSLYLQANGLLLGEEVRRWRDAETERKQEVAVEMTPMCATIISLSLSLRRVDKESLFGGHRSVLRCSCGINL